MDEPKRKICPILTSGERQVGPHSAKCLEHQCQWWTQAYTTENKVTWDCAEVIKAHLNSDGQYVV